jgi:hypothetical protein
LQEKIIARRQQQQLQQPQTIVLLDLELWWMMYGGNGSARFVSVVLRWIDNVWLWQTTDQPFQRH